MITYCLDLYSEFLTFSQLLELDKTKSMFLKRALSLHSSASSTLVHKLVETPFFCEELYNDEKMKFDNNSWTSYQNYRRLRREDIDTKYGVTGPAFQNQAWKRNNQRNRHYYTRATIHGFHHLICFKSSCYEVNETCKCILCNSPLSLYHISNCSFKKNTLSQTVMFLVNMRGENDSF